MPAAPHRPAPLLSAPVPRGAGVLRAVRQCLVFLLGGALAAVAVTYLLPVLREHRSLAGEEERVRAERDAMAKAVAHEQSKLHWLQYDRGYLEMRARDRLDMQKPGEVVVRFERRR